MTGEGVAVELPVAGLPLRMASGAIDLLATLVLLLGVTYLFTTLTGQASDAVIATFGILTVVVVLVIVPTLVETISRGRSLGKWALGLRIVRDDGGPITMRHALTRALIGTVEGFPFMYVPAVTAALIHPRGKRLGDMAAGTYAVSQRAKLVLVAPPEMPPDLERWALGADIAALPPGLAISIRQFLTRRHQLGAQARATLGQQLLVEAARFVAPAPPAGHHPEAVLSAIIADRRRRDGERLAREQALRDRLVR